MTRLEIASGWIYEVRRRPDGNYDLRPANETTQYARAKHGTNPPINERWPLRTKSARDGSLVVCEVRRDRCTTPAAEFEGGKTYADGPRLRYIIAADDRLPLFDSLTSQPL